MKNKVLEKIKKLVVDELRTAYGYVGVADSDDQAILNSDDCQGKEIKITIKLGKG
jgi:hypothetical protein